MNQKPSTNKETRAERALLKKHYGAKEEKFRHRLLRHIRLEKPRFWWAEASFWKRLAALLCASILLMVGSMYGIARWYIAKHSHQEMKYGVTFIPRYARYYKLDPQETMQAMITDLNIRHFRLVSYWDDIEKTPGTYDFSELDWQMQKVADVGGTVSLSIGLRQPRWPECHEPTWVKSEPKDVWYPQLKTFMAKVIDRYKTNSALESYQLENEYFLKVFGKCTDFSRDRLVDEFNFVKQQDPKHTVIISRSNNWVGLPLGDPTPDKFGISVYKRVWDKTFTHRYVEYPYPAWFYGFLAGAGEILTGKDMIIHELQAEPWTPSGGIADATIAEQSKSLDATRLKQRFTYGKATGMREVDLWGAEMWYWRKVSQGDASLWNAAKDALRENQCNSCY